jgi:hypothetical protein
MAIAGLPELPERLPRRIVVTEDAETGVFLVRLDDVEKPYFDAFSAHALAGWLMDPRLCVPPEERRWC